MRRASIALALALALSGCHGPTGPTTFSWYRFDLLSRADPACLHNPPRVIPAGDPMVVFDSGQWQIVQWPTAGVIAVFEVTLPVYRFCSVLGGAR